MNLSRRMRRVLAGITGLMALLAALVVTGVVAGRMSGAGHTTTTSDTLPVNLSAKIDMANGRAAQAATVAAGDARFEVLTPARGYYPGAPATRTYTVDLVDVSRPRAVLIDGRPLPTSGWTYDDAARTLEIPLAAVPTDEPVTVTQVGGSPVQAPEPTAAQLTINSATTTSGTTIPVIPR